MPPGESTRLKGLRKPVFVLLCLWFVLLIVAVNVIVAKLQAASLPGLPFGISSSNGAIYAQDFSYNLLYFHGIQDRFVSRPYRLEDQEAMMRHVLPGITSGMSHAYSPVAFVLIQPLLAVSGRNAYLIYTILCAAAALLLFYFYLLPRAEVSLQFYALIICAVNVWVVTTLAVGQSSLITTAFLGGFWALLARRSISVFWLGDFCIAAFFWALCLKPSVAVLPGMLLLGAKAWRPLIIGGIFLLITWTILAGHYGGWWTGLQDYLYLLNHYHNADFTPFMQRFSETPEGRRLTALLFSLDRNLVLTLNLVLLALRWARRISGSEQFQGMIWVFLLFFPYLLPSENWILCLLVVEGSFFRSRNSFLGCGKLLLLMGILNLRANVTFPTQVDFPLKCLLFAWVVVELIQTRKALPIEKSELIRSAHNLT